MRRTKSSIKDKDVPNLIRRLRAFLGYKRVDKMLEKYQLSLASSGPFYVEYYLSKRHPWWSAFISFNELNKRGKSIRKHLSNEILSLASDAKKIINLQKIMPESVQDKYRSNLLSDSNPRGFLFEIDIAWHYFLKGYRIIWYESETNSHPEFNVTAPTLEFDVECKTIGVDTFRRIRRRDFYHFIDILIPKISEMKLTGEIQLTFKNRFPQNISKLQIISDEILKQLGPNSGNVNTSFGDMVFKLSNNNDKSFDFNKMHKNLLQNKPPHAHAVLKAGNLFGGPVNPIKIICKCELKDDLLTGVRRILGKASKNQLSPEIPGYLACFIPEIDDFAGLDQNSGIQNMTFDLFDKGKTTRTHLAAISYSSDTRFFSMNYGLHSEHPALLFRNAYCRFEEASNFNFIDLKDQSAAS